MLTVLCMMSCTSGMRSAPAIDPNGHACGGAESGAHVKTAVEGTAARPITRLRWRVASDGLAVVCIRVARGRVAVSPQVDGDQVPDAR